MKSPLEAAKRLVVGISLVCAVLLTMGPATRAQSLRIRVRLEAKTEFHLQDAVLTADLSKTLVTGTKDEVRLSEFHYDKIDPVNFTIHYPKIPKLKTGQYRLLIVYRVGQSGAAKTKALTVSAVHGRHIYTDAKFTSDELKID